MSLRTDWDTAKSDARARNKGQEVKIETGSGLGRLLDDWEAKVEAYEKVRGARTTAEGTARTAAENAGQAAEAALTKYQAWLKSNPTALAEVSAEARTILSNRLTQFQNKLKSHRIRLGLLR